MSDHGRSAASADAATPEGLRYDLDDRMPVTVTILAALQWVLFSLPITVVVPVVLSSLLNLPPDRTAAFISQSLVVVGFASLLQVLFGHRLPMLEGPAGLWWAVFIPMVQSAGAFGQSGLWMMQNLQTGVLLAGVLIAALGIFGLVRRVRAWFTPAVTGTFLTLLALSLAGTLVRGMLDVTADHGIRLHTATVAFGTLVLVLVLSRMRGLLRNFALLIGILVGWLVFQALGFSAAAPARAAGLFALPTLFPWGPPGFNAGVLLTAAIAGLVNLGNMIGALVAMERVIKRPLAPAVFDRAAAWSGLAHIMAGGGGAIGTSPFAAAAGAVAVSGIATRLPFIIGAVVMGLLGLVPGVGALMAGIPAPVGNAVVLVAFIQIYGFGLAEFYRVNLPQTEIYRVGLPVLMGAGLFVLPPAAFAALPVTIRFTAANGIIVGTILALVIDALITRIQRRSGATAATPSAGSGATAAAPSAGTSAGAARAPAGD